MRKPPILLVIFIVSVVLFISYNVYGGKLYIKPQLEIKRAERLLNEAEQDFRNGKIHITLSPEIACTEFEMAKDKYKQAIEIIEDYGEGYYTPGDVEDFTKRMNECAIWIKNSSLQIKK